VDGSTVPYEKLSVSLLFAKSKITMSVEKKEEFSMVKFEL